MKISFTDIKMMEYRIVIVNDKSIEYFKEGKGLVYCHDIGKIFVLFKYLHISAEWRLFIDCSSSALKAVFLHNGNIQPTVPVAYSTTTSETCDVVEFLLNKTKYQQYRWPICADLKVVKILMGIQSGNVKYPCHICLWDSLARPKQYNFRTAFTIFNVSKANLEK